MAGETAGKVKKDEAFNNLKKRVDKIRQKVAEDHSEEEIKKKFSDIFNGYNWEKKTEGDEAAVSSLLSFAWSAFKLSFLMLLFVILVIIGSYIAVNNNPYLAKKMKNIMHDRNIAYIFARYMRKISLPLHAVVDLKKAQKWECLVQNPFYKPEEPSCELCEQPLEILDFPASSKDAKKVTESGEPTIIVDEPDFKNCRYNYTFLREFYYKNKADLDFSVCEVYGDRGNQKLEDFFKSSEEEILKSKMSFGWKNCRIEGTRALRQLFRRPSFVPLMSEIYLEKCLFIIHRDSPTKFVLPSCGTSNCFIAQVHGSSQVTLTPFEDCKRNCSGTERTDLKVGEIFYYPDQPWTVTVEATNEDLSIIYRSDFS